MRLSMAGVLSLFALTPHVAPLRALVSMLPAPLFRLALFAHDHLGVLILVCAIVSLGTAIGRMLAGRRSIAAIEAIASEPPAALLSASRTTADPATVRAQLRYVEIATSLCFTAPNGRIVVSRGFVERCDAPLLATAMQHELTHVRASDGLWAIAWRCAFAVCLMPCDVLEGALHARRERRASRETARTHAVRRKLDPKRALQPACLLAPRALPEFIRLSAGATSLGILAAHALAGS